MSCLGDTALFKENAEVTTKELLKRYAHYGKMNGAQKTVAIESGGDYAQEGSGQFRNNAPVVTRVDSDSSQANAWQKQSSAKQVHQPAPQSSRDFQAPRSPYRGRNNSHGSQTSLQQKRSGPVAASGA